LPNKSVRRTSVWVAGLSFVEKSYASAWFGNGNAVDVRILLCGGPRRLGTHCGVGMFFGMC
jgi:hypothetical protein